MPGRSKGAQLVLEPEYRRKDGYTVKAVWTIRDGRTKRRLGIGPETCRDAGDPQLQRLLASYIAERHQVSRARNRHPAEILIADVLTIYMRDCAPNMVSTAGLGSRARKLLDWWGTRTLANVNGQSCRAYADQGTNTRRELEDLRAAINHHRKEGLCSEIVEVVLPPRGPARERWLTRSEAARLLWAAYRTPSRRHLARFMLVALYTGTRAGTVLAAALTPSPGCPWLDLDRGVFYRRPEGAKETKKRQPPVRVPDSLLAHLRRWKRLGLCYRHVVEWEGKPIRDIHKIWARIVADAGLDHDVIPHTLRHTCASWGMQNGADHGALADYLGMTVEMLRKVYGHHDPNYHADVKNAISGKRNIPSTSNVVRIAR